jgi:predicted MPP superfamily phosphohydrolase
MKKFSIILGAIILVLFVTLIIWGVYCDNTIAITNYCVNNTKNDAKLKFVVITDLHNKEYGEKNADLAELVKEQNPDFIAVCGDMVNRGDPDTTKMKDVLEKLSKIAPTYCCLGNHERDNAAKFGTDFKSETNSTGAVLLDNEYIKFTKNGKSVLIGGMSDYPYYEFYTPDDDVPSRTLWEEFAEKAKNNFTILLHHQPEYIAEDAKKTDIDLIVCGHTHGGQIQLPFIGGVIAPNQGLFPKYDKGEFDLDGTKMIVCAGLSNTVFIPRITSYSVKQFSLLTRQILHKRIRGICIRQCYT